ncbi:MAG TPA: hypothetical protein VK750_02035, partial [Cytophagaceae bacterium]|nr:hypothetical protein [Cytophagaceae bacterium]
FYQRILKYLFGFALFIQVTLSHAGTSYVWNKTAAGTYNWTDASNWSPSTGYPGNTAGVYDDVVIGTATSLQTITLPSSTTITLNSITCTGTSTYLRTLDMTGCTFSIGTSGTSGTNALFTYVKVMSAASISIYAGTQVKMISSTFGDFAITIVSSSTTATDTQGNQALYLSSSTFGVNINSASFTAVAKTLGINNSKFYTQTTITKADFNSSNVAAPSANNEYNTYYGTTTLTSQDNSANSSVVWAAIGDTFNGITTINNNSSNQIIICAASGTVNFNNHTYFNNTSTGGMNISNALACSVNFNGNSSTQINTFFSNSGASTIYLSNYGALSFNYATIVLGNTSTGGITIGNVATSTGVITISSTSTLNAYPDAAHVPSTAPATPYFSSGLLAIDRSLIKCSSSVILSLGTSASLDLRSGNVFGSLANNTNLVSSAHYVGIGGVYNGTASFTELDGGSSGIITNIYNSTTFNGNVSFINQHSLYWGFQQGTTYSLTFNTTASSQSFITVQNQAAGVFYFGYYGGNYNFNNVTLDFVREPVIINSILITPGPIVVGSTTTNITVNGSSSIVQIDQTAGSSYIQLGATSGTTLFTLYGSMNTNNFTNGTLSFGNFVANTPLTITSTSTANSATTILLYATVVFNQNVTMTCQNFGSYGGLYNGTTVFNAIGSWNGSHVFIGTHTFNGSATFNINTGSGLIVGNSTSSIFNFNGDVNVNLTPTSGTGKPQFSFPNQGTAYFKGNLTYNGDFGSSVAPFGSAGGTCIFNGTANQTISNTNPLSVNPNPLLFTSLQVNKTSGKLILGTNTNITISKYGSISPVLTLALGNMVTSSTSLLTLADACVIGTSGSGVGGPTSFVEGPLKKIGNIPSGSIFTFPIGKSTTATPSVLVYMPLTISMPSSTTKAFTAEFFNQYQTAGNTIDASIKDVQNCQYWNLTSSGTAASVTVGLYWNNTVGQTCYPVNPNVVSVARFNTTTSAWQKEASTAVGTTSGTVTTTAALSSYGYFALGYRNALILNTFNTNPTKFNVSNNIEPITSVFTSGSSGSSAGDKTILSSAKNVAGNVVVHPSFSSEVDVQINQLLTGTPTDPKANYVNYTLLNEKIYTTAEGSTNVVDHVTIDEDGDNTFLQLLSDVHQINGNTLTFYKQKPAPVLFELTNNLSDAITYTVDRYLTIPYSPFQITSTVPTGYSATLNVYDNSGSTTPIYTNNTDLSWNAKTGTTTFSPEGLYHYEVVLTNGTNTKTYKGQLILKQQ